MDATYAMLKGRYDEELRLYPVPQTADDIPISYAAITPQWLSQVLCASHAGAEVIACSLGPHDEGTSSRRRIHLEYKTAGKAADNGFGAACPRGFEMAEPVVSNCSARWRGVPVPWPSAPNAPEMQPRDSSLQFIGRMATATAIDDLDALQSFR